jgi:CheY-like chemotaxis protein
MAQAAPERRERPRSDSAPVRHRVMVVDDNNDAAAMLGMLLEAAGHEVEVHHGSLAALEAAGAQSPAICILDIGLPDMDGYQLARRLRQVAGMDRAMLVAVTGYGQEEDRLKALAAGFDHHMVKPVDTARLLRLMAERRPMQG